MFSYMVSEAVKKDKYVLILTNRIELLTSTGGTLQQFGIEYDIIHKDKEPKYKNKCIIAMAQTLKRREHLFQSIIDKVDLIIIDESHLSEIDSLFDAGLFDNKYIIGCTATPKRQGKMRELATMYKQIIYTLSTQELIEQGYLVPAKTYSVPVGDFSACKTVSRNGETEFKEKDVLKILDKIKIYEGIAENYKTICPDTIALVFCVNKEHTINTATYLNNNGIKCEFVISGSDRGAIDRWKRGDFKVLVNCGILTTGFDFPPCETIILNRACYSENLYLQMCGRGSRISNGKTHFNILDFGDNYNRHQAWQQERIYSLFHKKAKSDGVGIFKECGVINKKKVGGCGALINSNLKTCPYCGFMYDTETIEIDGIEVMLREIEYKDIVNSEVSLMDLEKYRENKGYKLGWIIHQMKYRGNFEHEIYKYASIKGYKRGWAWSMVNRYN